MQRVRFRRPFSFYVGNIFILTSLLGFFYIGYPIGQLYLFPKNINTTVEAHQAFAISIPKISAAAPVISQVDPFDEIVYKNALKKGVAHAKGTALPGARGTIFLFAHSSAYPWELTRFNTPFLRLAEVTHGDEIHIVYQGIIYKYRVSDKKEVAPDEVSYLLKKQNHSLILQTCTPIGTALRRLLVFADPVISN